MDPTPWQQVGELRQRELLMEADERRVASKFRNSNNGRWSVARLILGLRRFVSGQIRMPEPVRARPFHAIAPFHHLDLHGHATCGTCMQDPSTSTTPHCIAR
jgi:hypothetical protein